MEERLEQAELDALWLPGDPIASAERLAAAAAERDRSEVVRAELETQRARALGLQGRFGEAEALLESLEPAGGVLEVRVLLERGRLRTASGRSDEAVPVLEAALRAARRDGDLSLGVESALVLADADRPRALQWIEEGLSDLAATGDPRTLRWGAVLYDLRGWVLLRDGDADAALASFEDAVEYAEAYGTLDQQFAAHWAVGRCLRELGRTAEAREIQRRLASERPDEPAVQAELEALSSAPDET
ncbi:tetratricopeptide repeat protein [Leifsonia sp. 21MFCrub1.1]|uniref:tetratricopeptide repeat protein n=1 Tax=Leifsonia sp. 21MFCrub1.1 TaxID=1798223 RepID=UPI001E381341|nr:tetratricopeptide repeat protein [Leifsonia sp. 21MFCrub1.1]